MRQLLVIVALSIVFILCHLLPVNSLHNNKLQSTKEPKGPLAEAGAANLSMETIDLRNSFDYVSFCLNTLAVPVVMTLAAVLYNLVLPPCRFVNYTITGPSPVPIGTLVLRAALLSFGHVWFYQLFEIGIYWFYKLLGTAHYRTVDWRRLVFSLSLWLIIHYSYPSLTTIKLFRPTHLFKFTFFPAPVIGHHYISSFSISYINLSWVLLHVDSDVYMLDPCTPAQLEEESIERDITNLNRTLGYYYTKFTHSKYKDYILGYLGVDVPSSNFYFLLTCEVTNIAILGFMSKFWRNFMIAIMIVKEIAVIIAVIIYALTFHFVGDWKSKPGHFPVFCIIFKIVTRLRLGSSFDIQLVVTVIINGLVRISACSFILFHYRPQRRLWSSSYSLLSRIVARFVGPRCPFASRSLPPAKVEGPTAPSLTIPGFFSTFYDEWYDDNNEEDSSYQDIEAFPDCSQWVYDGEDPEGSGCEYFYAERASNKHCIKKAQASSRISCANPLEHDDNCHLFTERPKLPKEKVELIDANEHWNTVSKSLDATSKYYDPTLELEPRPDDSKWPYLRNPKAPSNTEPSMLTSAHSPVKKTNDEWFWFQEASKSPAFRAPTSVSGDQKEATATHKYPANNAVGNNISQGEEIKSENSATNLSYSVLLAIGVAAFLV